MYYLIKYEDNYADEIEIDGHVVLMQEEYEAFTKAIENIKPFEFCIGTNENIDYQNEKEVKKTITITTITKEELQMLKNLGLKERGFARSFTQAVHCGAFGDEYRQVF